MNSARKLWIYLAALLIGPFATLLWTGGEIYRASAPMPERVVSTDGEVIYTRAGIELGRQVWQSMGGMQLGPIWGHGAYRSLFGNDPATAELREAYAMKNDTVPDAEHRRALTAFFWWTAWATVTERPGSNIAYTNNWPSEPLVGNTPPASLFLWSAFSVILLLAGIALLGWHQAVTEGRHREPHELPATDPMSHEGGCKVFLGSAGDVPPADPARHDCLRGLKPDLVWSERLLKTSLWSFNIGLRQWA